MSELHNSSPAEHFTGSPALKSALRKILRPFVRFLLGKGITYPMAIALLKQTYVESAAEDFALDNKRQTDSRISLISGVHRKDVRRLLREQSSDDDAPPSAPASLGLRVVARWCSDPRFMDTHGLPATLSRQATPDNGANFDALVAAESKDIRARALLDEWLRLGVVTLTEDHCVRLNTTAFIPSKDEEEKLFFFGRQLQDHIEAGASNVHSSKPPYLDRSVYHSGLNAMSVVKLETMARALSEKALLTLNAEALKLKAEQDAADETTLHRFSFGTYAYHAPTETPSPSEDDKEQARS